MKHHHFFCKFRDIHLQFYDFCKIEVLKNNILSKDNFQLLKDILNIINEFNLLHLISENAFLLCIRKEICFEMINQEWDYIWIILYELMIEVDKVKKHLNFFHHFQLWLILNDLHSILLHWNFFFSTLYSRKNSFFLKNSHLKSLMYSFKICSFSRIYCTCWTCFLQVLLNIKMSFR